VKRQIKCAGPPGIPSAGPRGPVWRAAVAVVTLAVLPSCGGAADKATSEPSGAKGAVTAAAPSVSETARCPSPVKPVTFSQPSPWRVIGRTGPEGFNRDKDVSESTMTITNANSVAVTAKALVLVDDARPGSTYGGLIEYGVPRATGLRSDGGTDYRVSTPTEVPPGASVQVAARRLTTPSASLKAQYGYAEIAAQLTVTETCDIPVAGADPIRLLPAGRSAQGCTDPVAWLGC
jgi:hypothetical protein